MEPQKKSLPESLRISRKFPTPFFCCKAVKLQLSYALKLCHLRFFYHDFFCLHVVWTQQLLHQIKLKSLESLQNYAHKNSWANPVCMMTFPTMFARLTVHHFTQMATLWTGPLWHSSSYTEIHLHIIVFYGRYEIVGPHNKYLSNLWILDKKKEFFFLSPIFQVSDELDDLLAAYQMSKHGRKYIIFLQNRNDLEWN